MRKPERFSMQRSQHGGWYVFDSTPAPGEKRCVGYFCSHADASTWISDQYAGRVSEVIFSRV